MRVIHVAPTALGASGLFGGGERYPIELAPAPGRLGGVERELWPAACGGVPPRCLAAYRAVVT